MRTTKLNVVNPKRATGYDADKLSVTASIEIVLECTNEADQVRAMFALDTIWRECFSKLDGLTHNEPLPASEDAAPDLTD